MNRSGFRLEFSKPPSSRLGVSDQGWMTLDQADREYIERVLEATEGRIAGPGGAAEILDLNPSTLRSRLKKLGLLK